MIEVIRNEHNRIYMQDQALLSTIKEQAREDQTISIDPMKATIQAGKTEDHERQGEALTAKVLERKRLAAEEKRKGAIYSLKSLALIEENMAYEYQELEESLINFLLAQVVVMREKPFVEATQQLEKNLQMNKIMEMIAKIPASSSFASKADDKNLKIAMANKSQLNTTQPYDGTEGLRNADNLDEQIEDQFNTKAAGKALFKVKTD